MKIKGGNKHTTPIPKREEAKSKVAVLYRRGDILIYNRKDGPPPDKIKVK